jgi:hypothetical protein
MAATYHAVEGPSLPEAAGWNSQARREEVADRLVDPICFFIKVLESVSVAWKFPGQLLIESVIVTVEVDSGLRQNDLIRERKRLNVLLGDERYPDIGEEGVGSLVCAETEEEWESPEESIASRRARPLPFLVDHQNA